MAFDIGAFEYVSAGTTITLTPATLVITESTLQIDRPLNLTSDSLVIAGGSLSVVFDSVVTLSPDALVISNGFLSVSTAGNTTIAYTPDTLVLPGGSLTVDYNVITIVDVYTIMLEVQATLEGCCG